MLKKIFTPIVAGDGFVRLGFESTVLEMEDPDGTVFQLLNLLDGTKDSHSLAAVLGVPLSEVDDAILALDEALLLEDAAATSSLLQRQTERYRANINFFSNFSTLKVSKYYFQERLTQSSVAVLGLGGASLVANCLAGLGVGNIVGVDYDRVEISNLNRQFLYSESDIGRPKSEATAARLGQINSDIRINTHDRLVDSARSLVDLLAGVDLVINGIDQPAIMSTRWVNAACVHLDIPFIQGGINNTKMVWQRIVPGVSGCFDCFLIDTLRKDPEFELQLRTAHGVSFTGRNTATAPHAALLSGFLSAEAAKCLAGHHEPLTPGVTVEMDTLTLNMVTKPAWTKFPDCPTCGASVNRTAAVEPVGLDQLVLVARSGVGIP